MLFSVAETVACLVISCVDSDSTLTEKTSVFIASLCVDLYLPIIYFLHSPPQLSFKTCQLHIGVAGKLCMHCLITSYSH